MEKTKSNGVIEHELFIMLQRAALKALEEVSSVFKTVSLSPAQYNVLRILRGSQKEPVSCSTIAGRMITRDSDITRLVDRLEQQGLARRARECKDRRVIYVRITGQGLRLLQQLDERVLEFHRQQFHHLSATERKSLLSLLKKSVKER